MLISAKKPNFWEDGVSPTFCYRRNQYYSSSSNAPSGQDRGAAQVSPGKAGDGKAPSGQDSAAAQVSLGKASDGKAPSGQDSAAAQVSFGQDSDANQVSFGQDSDATQVSFGQDSDAAQVSFGQDSDAAQVSSGQDSNARPASGQASEPFGASLLGGPNSDVSAGNFSFLFWVPRVPTLITLPLAVSLQVRRGPPRLPNGLCRDVLQNASRSDPASAPTSQKRPLRPPPSDGR